MLMVGQMVTWGAPALAWMGVAAASAPVIIHLLTRLRRRPVPWGAMRFLLEAYRRHRSRLRLEQLLLLVVRCLILAVLGLALAGPLLAGWSGFGGDAQSGRLVCLVLDDGLTAQATGFEGERRFDRLKAAAMGIIDGLEAGDEVAVWRAARPVSGLSDANAAPSSDHAEVRRRLEALEPRFSRSDLPAALNAVLTQAVQTPAGQRRPAERVIVVVLSDWSLATLGEEARGGGASELAELSGRCRLFTVRPDPAAENVQITALSPRRYLLLAEVDGSASIPVEVRLRRFVDEPGESEAMVTITATDAADRPLGQPVTHRQRWLAGQVQTSFGAELALSRDAVELHGGAAVPVTLTATLEQRRAGDALAPDDVRWSLVQVRRRLRVGLVDTAGAWPSGQEDVSPRQWLALALAPGGAADEDRLELLALDANRLNADMLGALDAALVLRPDLLNAEAWRSLGDLAQRGGVVWIFAPPDAATTVWADAMREALGVPWQLGLEVQSAGGDGDQPAFESWPLAADHAAPELLDLLAVDWADLLRPVRVTRRLPLALPGGASPLATVWLSTADGQPLMVAAELGAGRVLLLATALDATWTNLTTKPLFVPLVHESLRASLGASAAVASLSDAVTGARLQLRGPWNDVAALQLEQATVTLEARPDGAASATVAERPGVYHAVNDAQRRVAVNVDADAGDTRALDADAVERWFTALGGVQWLNPDRPAAILEQQVTRAALGWPLLWVVLALVLLEAFLARWFSHARAESWISWPQRVVRWIRG